MPTAHRYEPGLDGLRALAVAAVLAYHDDRLPGGFLGVSAFFTLSGFLITSLVLRERADNQHVALRAFFSRRARRLVPAIVLGVLLAAAVTPSLHDAGAARAFRFDAITTVTNVANWRFVLAGRSYLALFATPSPLEHFWSLAVEVQFYFAFVPLVVGALALGRGRRGLLYVMLVVLIAVSFATGLLWVNHGSFDRAYYGTDTRAAEYLIGALVGALLARGAPPRWLARLFATIGPLALVGAIVIVARTRLDADLFRGPLLVFAALNAVLAVAACTPGVVQSVLSVSPLVWLGRISYGVYVYHWPLYLLLDHQRTGLGPLALTAVRVAATLAVAIASYVLVEQPIRSRRRIRGRTRWIVLPAGIVAASVAGSAIAATAPNPAIHFAPVGAATAAAAPAAMPSLAPSHAARQNESAPVRRIMVVGDSVALTLGRGIERWGARNGMAVLNVAMLGCGLLNRAEVRGYWGTERRDADPCRQRPLWRQTLARFRPDVIVVLFGAWDVYDASWDGGRTWLSPGNPTWNAHYETDVVGASAVLRSTGARVLWLAPPCFADISPNDTTPPPWYSPTRVAIVGSIERRAAARDGDLITYTVHQHGCPVNLAVRQDGVHYSDRGADAVAPFVGQAIMHAGRAPRARS